MNEHDVVSPNKIRFEPDGKVYFTEDVYLSWEDGTWYFHQGNTATAYPTGLSLSAGPKLQ